MLITTVAIVCIALILCGIAVYKYVEQPRWEISSSAESIRINKLRHLIYHWPCIVFGHPNGVKELLQNYKDYLPEGYRKEIARKTFQYCSRCHISLNAGEQEHIDIPWYNNQSGRRSHKDDAYYPDDDNY